MQDPSPEAIHCTTSQARTTAVNLFAILTIYLNRIAVRARVGVDSNLFGYPGSSTIYLQCTV